ncbi:MAG: stage 0 sporulation family protein [Chloroflexi bacterium]|nr:stage 0 sporulation family protein [Chloroflexota bacterium]
MPSIVGVRFHKIGKLYHFDASALPDLREGDRVIVETARGKQMGEAVAFVPFETQQSAEGGYKPIERMATPRDLVMQQMWHAKETEATIECRARAAELQLPVKVVMAEYNYDGTRLTFLFSAEGDDKADTRSLRADMQRLFPKPHVELRQIGPRDVAKILGGLGACGLETRCCSMFLTEFSPVSIKMAKEQGISLNPQEITGMCGRLRCCLVYEYEQYVAARKSLPRRGKRVGTPKGEGKVLDVNPLKESVFVEIGEAQFEFSKEELVPLDELEALKTKSDSPCDRHEGGGCNCGRAKKK